MMEEGGEDETEDDGINSTRMRKDAKATTLVEQWLDIGKPFDSTRDEILLVSFVTGYINYENKDSVNPGKAMAVEKI